LRGWKSGALHAPVYPLHVRLFWSGFGFCTYRLLNFMIIVQKIIVID